MPRDVQAVRPGDQDASAGGKDSALHAVPLTLSPMEGLRQLAQNGQFPEQPISVVGAHNRLRVVVSHTPHHQSETAPTTAKHGARQRPRARDQDKRRPALRGTMVQAESTRVGHRRGERR